MQVKETRLRNFVVIQLLDENQTGSENLLEIRLEPNFNNVRINASHAQTEPGPERVILYLTPPKSFNKNIYVVMYVTQNPKAPCWKFTIFPEGIRVQPDKLLFSATSPEQAYGRLLRGRKDHGIFVFGMPTDDELPSLLAVQLLVGERLVKFLVGIANEDRSVDPAPFNKLLARLKTPSEVLAELDRREAGTTMLLKKT